MANRIETRKLIDKIEAFVKNRMDHHDELMVECAKKGVIERSPRLSAKNRGNSYHAGAYSLLHRFKIRVEKYGAFGDEFFSVGEDGPLWKWTEFAEADAVWDQKIADKRGGNARCYDGVFDEIHAIRKELHWAGIESENA